MNDRRIVLRLLLFALLLEGIAQAQSGLMTWLISGPHSLADLRSLLVDWRMALSVGLVAVIL